MALEMISDTVAAADKDELVKYLNSEEEAEDGVIS